MSATIKLQIEGVDSQPLKASDYQKLADSAARKLELPADLQLRFVDEATMQLLNRRSSDQDYATDVLSINYNEHTPTLPHELSAEVVICPAVAAQNASKAGVSLEQELKTLFVHGLVHIAGYDHASPGQKNSFDQIAGGIID